MREASKELEDLYAQRALVLLDTNEHFPALRKYASECDMVVEFGTRTGVSTTALLAAQPKELHCWDIVRYNEVEILERLAGNTKFVFHQQNSLDANFESADLLFFDSLHSYNHVMEEMNRHAHKINKYLIFHDVFAWAYIDESPSNNPTDTDNYSRAHKKGVGKAVGDFMENHPEWRIHDLYMHQSGLAVYKRV